MRVIRAKAKFDGRHAIAAQHLLAGAIQMNLPEHLFPRIGFVRGVIDDALLRIDPGDAQYLPVAMRQLPDQGRIARQRIFGVIRVEIEMRVAIPPTAP